MCVCVEGELIAGHAYKKMIYLILKKLQKFVEFFVMLNFGIGRGVQNFELGAYAQRQHVIKRWKK